MFTEGSIIQDNKELKEIRELVTSSDFLINTSSNKPYLFIMCNTNYILYSSQVEKKEPMGGSMGPFYGQPFVVRNYNVNVNTYVEISMSYNDAWDPDSYQDVYNRKVFYLKSDATITTGFASNPGWKVLDIPANEVSSTNPQFAEIVLKPYENCLIILL